nr:hypothetical protein [Tanacetum cinerariifolium]
SDICQLIRKECCVEAKEEQEVKNVVEQSAERGNRKSNAENLLPIPSKCEVTLEDKKEYRASLPDPEIVSVEEENVVQQEEEEVDFEDISQIQDVVLREKLLSITRLIYNIESLNNNPTLDRVLNSFVSDNSLFDNFSPEFETFCDHTKETRSGNTTHANYSLPEYDLFCFEIENTT